MTLLTPIPAIVGAAIAVPALLLLYFLKLRRKPVRVSSILLWERAHRDTQVNVPFRMIRASWLLALQLLALALLLLALGRPVVYAGQPPAERTIVVVDRSASMSAVDESLTRFERAVERARAIVRALPAGARVGVVSFAAAARVECDPTPDRARALDALDRLRPTDQPGAAGLGAAMTLAAEALATGEDEADRVSASIVLITDAAPPEVPGRMGGAGVRTIAVAERPAENVGIVALAARRDPGDPGTVRVLVRVASTSATLATVRVTLDGKPVDSRVVELLPATADAEGRSQSADGGVAGVGSVEFSVATREGGVLTARVDRADALACDNEASVVLESASKPRIVVVVPEGEPSPWMVMDVLEALALPVRVVSSGTGVGEADLVIYDRVSPRALPACASLSFGAGVPGLMLTEGGAGTGGRVLSWRREHPVLRGVSLDGVYVARALAWADAPREVLASGAAGPLIGLSEDHARRVVVAFELAQSNWPLTAGFPVFVASAVDFLTLRARRDAGMSVRTGEAGELVVPSDAPRSLVLEGPERLDLSAVPRVPGEQGTARLALAPVERAGVYRGPRGIVLAANLEDRAETLLAWAGGKARPIAAARGESPRRSSDTGEPMELLPWLLIGALVVSTVEYVLSARLQRA
ncbi:MAG: VWA domain-containing protein [Phycisphaerae bacterium]|nr:VWA domain-containing protein [Phycisphaerae bacterium]